MRTLREALEDARQNKTAIGHFNVSDSVQFQGIIEAAEETSAPVIIGVSEGERAWIGLHEIVGLVRTVREKRGVPVFLNADHTRSLEGIREAVDAGFDTVLFDGSKLDTEENIEQTKEAVSYARNAGHDVLVEGELGYIGSSSKLLDAVPEDVDTAMTDPEAARQFVAETGIDLLAPSVGNLHGILKDRANPALNIERIAAIRDAADIPMVLHGGSGVSDDDFSRAIEAGMTVVHISTEIRVAYRDGIKSGLEQKPDEIAPYRYMEDAKEAVKRIVKERLALFRAH